MCDTLVSITDDGVLFAKNSDRDPNESQRLVWSPAGDHGASTSVAATWIEIDQVPCTNAVVLSQPWWMWGAEMGANEHGVVIGNEAVFTNVAPGDPALLGMDLVRVGLERASTASDAVSVIVELLERYGQGGSCSQIREGFTYDNSFLVADPHGAFVLETVGRSWAVEAVTGRGRSISNGLTIPDFARCHADGPRSERVRCVQRRRRTEASAATATSPTDLFGALRDHGGPASPRWSEPNGCIEGPCVHAGGFDVATQTTSSWVSDLRSVPLHWATATAAPCTSVFKPIRVDEPTDLGADPGARFDDRALWWRHELFHRRTMHDHDHLTRVFARERDSIESDWVADPPPTSSAFELATRLEALWARDIAALASSDHRPAWLRDHWTALDRAADVPEPAVFGVPRGGS